MEIFRSVVAVWRSAKSLTDLTSGRPTAAPVAAVAVPADRSCPRASCVARNLFWISRTRVSWSPCRSSCPVAAAICLARLACRLASSLTGVLAFSMSAVAWRCDSTALSWARESLPSSRVAARYSSVRFLLGLFAAVMAAARSRTLSRAVLIAWPASVSREVALRKPSSCFCCALSSFSRSRVSLADLSRALVPLRMSCRGAVTRLMPSRMTWRRRVSDMAGSR
jgi:hypothetical protein